MKPITLHPVSVLLGAALVGLSLVLTGAAQASFGTVRPVPTPEVRLVGEIPAEWWTFVELRSTHPFTVPANRYFVVTTTERLAGSVVVNGQPMDKRLEVTSYGSGQPFQGTRVVFAPGTLIQTTDPSPSVAANFWGYLEPVR